MNAAEKAYFDQIADAEPEPRLVPHYTVLNYFRRFAIFETTNRDEAMQVAKWETGDNPPADDLPEDRIVETIASETGNNTGYRLGGFFWLLHKEDEYRQRLDELARSNK